MQLERVLSLQIRELVPEADAYMQLLSFEQKLDRTLTRKKYDIQEALKRPMKTQHKLRIFVSHSFIPGREPEVSFQVHLCFIACNFSAKARTAPCPCGSCALRAG